jgi:hypothetical protein
MIPAGQDALKDSKAERRTRQDKDKKNKEQDSLEIQPKAGAQQQQSLHHKDTEDSQQKPNEQTGRELTLRSVSANRSIASWY